MDDIFKSAFTLKFRNEEIEKRYQAYRSMSIEFKNIIYSSFFILISIIYNIMYSSKPFQEKENEYNLYFIKQISNLLLGLNIIMLILSLLIKRLIYQRRIPYLSIYFFMVSNVLFRAFLLHFANIDYLIFTLTYLIQQFIIMTSFYFNCLDFIEGFLIYLIVSSTSYLIYSSLIVPRNHLKFVIDTIVTMPMNFMSYLFIEENRKSFYFRYMGNKNLRYFKNLIYNIKRIQH